MRVYRSVKVVFQNTTNELLTVQGTAALRGGWAEKLAPKQNDEIPEQATASWMSESREVGSGTSGFVRIGSRHGYSTLLWELPWVGDFKFTVTGPHGVRHAYTVDDSLPDAVVVSVLLETEPVRAEVHPRVEAGKNARPST